MVDVAICPDDEQPIVFVPSWKMVALANPLFSFLCVSYFAALGFRWFQLVRETGDMTPYELIGFTFYGVFLFALAFFHVRRIHRMSVTESGAIFAKNFFRREYVLWADVITVIEGTDGKFEIATRDVRVHVRPDYYADPVEVARILIKKIPNNVNVPPSLLELAFD